MKKIILASQSPRRMELMGQAGIPFTAVASHMEEHPVSTEPSAVVEELSLGKATAVARTMTEDCLVIGADTIVAADSEILGKPKDTADASRMLHLLSGRVHQVYSGVTILEVVNGKITRSTTFHERTDVHVCRMTDEEIDSYIRTGEPFDKAGAYAVQGKFGVYVSRIEGDYFTIVGLPISHLYHSLREFL
ncbi:MAG: Maf family protein [Lachnospiraceae bacterium]|jgi:septum formation protein